MELTDEVSISQHKLSRIWAALLEEVQGTLFLKYVTARWPSFVKLHISMTFFLTFREYLIVLDDIVYYLRQVNILATKLNRVLENTHLVTKVK